MRSARSSPASSAGVAFVCVLTLAACAKREARAVDAGETPEAPAASATADDEVRAVYPADGGAPDPRAARFCDVVHRVPEAKRAACCGERAGVIFADECVRTLSYALAAHAVTLDAAEVERCAAEVDATYAGCDWPGPFPPSLPAACDGIVKGGLALGRACRSSLECDGGLRCLGVGPTTMGRCGPPRADGERCGGSADTLASHTRQASVDRAHPECRGYCSRFKCAPLAEIGGACAEPRACGEGRSCVAGTCVAGAVGEVGAACPAGVCARDLVCVAGTCVARKAAGATCTRDFECVGGCVLEDGGAKGTCGRKCGVR